MQFGDESKAVWNQWSQGSEEGEDTSSNGDYDSTEEVLAALQWQEGTATSKIQQRKRPAADPLPLKAAGRLCMGLKYHDRASVPTVSPIVIKFIPNLNASHSPILPRKKREDQLKQWLLPLQDAPVSSELIFKRWERQPALAALKK